MPGTASAVSRSAAPTASYTYDSDGRLLSVTNASGLTSTYSYDTAGNIVGVSAPAATRRGGARPARSAGPGPELDRLHAPARAGSVLTLHGEHFNPAPELDKVTIGHLIAPVLRASSSWLAVRVPPGRGGAVEVMTPAGTARNGSVSITGGPVAAPPPATAAESTPALQAAAGVTALAGRVETASGRPLAGVRVRVNALWGTGGASGRTNASGWFLLSYLAPGDHRLVVNATSAGGKDYGIYAEPVQVPAGKTTVLPWVTYLTPIDTAHAVTIPSPTTSTVTVTNPALPGVAVKILAGTVIRDRHGNIVRKLSLTPLPLNRTPFPLAPGMPTFFTLQPGDATFSGSGARVIYANVTHLPPGSRVSYVALNPTWGQASWYQYGTGTVTASGVRIRPTTGTVFHRSMPFGYVPQPAPQEAPPPGGQSGGEPVDLATGLYVMNATDLTLRDSQPAVLTRTYRDQDDVVRGFGLGMEDGFDWFVTPDPVISGDYALVLPDGSRIDYAPSANPGVWNAVGTPTGFAGSVLTEGELHVSTWIVTLKDGAVYDFGAEQGLLVKVTNRYGSALTINRAEATGAIQTVTTPGGKWMRFTYGVCLPGSTPVDCVTSVTDDAGRTVAYTYDGNARLTGVTDAAGGRSAYTWAPCTNSLTCTELLTITDPNGIAALKNTYNSTTGAVVSQTDPDGGKWHYSYTAGVHGLNAKTTVTDPRGHRTVWAFDSNGYPATETAAAGTSAAQKTTFHYSLTTNQLLSTTDPLGRKTTYTYDGLGNVTSVTRLAGTAHASTTRYTYETVFNRIASVTDPDGNKTTWAYNDQARTVTVTDALGHKTVVTLDPALQPVEITDSLGHRTYLSYYDGDLIAVADPAKDITTAYYDGTGNPLQVTDPEGNTTHLTYNALGEVSDSTDPLGNATRFGYDPDGDLTSVTDPKGHATTYTYTPMLQLASATDPLSHKITYKYDTLGNLTKTIDRNGTVDTFAYDPLNRLASAVYGANRTSGKITLAAAYDAANRPISITETGNGTYSFTYNGLDEILAAKSPQGTVTYTYDVAGRRLTMTAPHQAQVKYAYNSDNLITGITQGTSKVTFGYDVGLRVATIGLPDGITRTDAYDAASRLTTITYKAGTTTVGAVAYTYTPDSQIATANGSLAATALPAPVTSAAFNADNELTKENGASYTYDKQGDLTSDGTSSYAWNALGELSAVKGPVTSAYSYDPLGRRVAMTTAGVKTSDLYDGSTLIQQTTGATITNYLAGGQDSTYQEATPAGAATLLTSNLGSVAALANPTGHITTSYTYSPGGVQASSGASSANTLGYIGAPADPTGLDQFGARYYSPKLDRFVSQDPTGFAGGTTNLYQYALDGPVNLSDPTGLSSDGGGGGGCSSGSSQGCGPNSSPGGSSSNNPDTKNSPPNPCRTGPEAAAQLGFQVSMFGLALAIMAPELVGAAIFISLVSVGIDFSGFLMSSPGYASLSSDLTGLGAALGGANPFIGGAAAAESAYFAGHEAGRHPCSL